MNNTIQKYEYIDALRGIAILAVLLHHTFHWISPSFTFISALAEEGNKGVQLFYVASALTLFLSMDSRKVQENHFLFNFFIRRFFRIAPMFYLAIIVYTSFYGLTERLFAPNGIEWWYIPLTAFFIHGWHPETINSIVPGGWSIAIEMTFYLMAPYLFNKLTSIRITLIALLLSIVLSKITSFLIFNYLLDYYPTTQTYLLHNFTFSWFFSQLPIFLLGILLFHIIKALPAGNKISANILLYSAIFIVFYFMGVQTYKNLLPPHVIYGLAFLLLALSLHFSANRILVNKTTVFIGRLSFSIYLVHFLIIEVLKIAFMKIYFIDSLQNDIKFIFAYLLVILLSCFVSIFTYKVIEKPGINIGKMIINKFNLEKTKSNKYI
jgi:peptidoglycan/LPS O-acetylase OafA/YrhL